MLTVKYDCRCARCGLAQVLTVLLADGINREEIVQPDNLCADCGARLSGRNIIWNEYPGNGGPHGPIDGVGPHGPIDGVGPHGPIDGISHGVM